jgi:hypothetical protein
MLILRASGAARCREPRPRRRFQRENSAFATAKGRSPARRRVRRHGRNPAATGHGAAQTPCSSSTRRRPRTLSPASPTGVSWASCCRAR